MLRNMCMSQLWRDERISEHKFADEIEQVSTTNRMWKAIARKACWTANSVPTTIKLGPNERRCGYNKHLLQG